VTRGGQRNLCQKDENDSAGIPGIPLSISIGIPGYTQVYPWKVRKFNTGAAQHPILVLVISSVGQT
jgi:hypothetical protein